MDEICNKVQFKDCIGRLQGVVWPFGPNNSAFLVACKSQTLWLLFAILLALEEGVDSVGALCSIAWHSVTFFEV